MIYLMAEPETPELARAAVEGGADIVELGFPFSDPLADGPVIRRAAERALARGMRTRACLDVLERARGLLPDTPLIPMTYASLLEAYGWEHFEADARAAGATSLIVADLPAGERPELRRVQLVAPTSTDDRLRVANLPVEPQKLEVEGALILDQAADGCSVAQPYDCRLISGRHVTAGTRERALYFGEAAAGA